jgi:hypothetical protein
VNAILIVDSVFAFRPDYNADFKKPRIMTQRQGRPNARSSA